MTAWRYRRCPACREVYRAGELRCLDYGGNWREAAVARRECPGCGYIGPTWRFQVVREKHPEPRGAEVAP